MNEIDLHRVDLNLLVVFEVLMETRSVTATAEKIGRTQSAVSHSLSRLREQLGDPLLVLVGGKMQPSPFAEMIVEDVRPLLRGIRRVISPRNLFVPASSERVFRIAMPTVTKVIAEVSARVEAEAPRVKIEWLPAHHDVYAALSEGLVDLAHLGGEPRLPDGLEAQVMAPFSWCCQTNANLSPLPLPRLGIRRREGRATQRERRRGSACSDRGSGGGAPLESGCGPRRGWMRTSAMFACAGTATSPARVVGMAGASFQLGC